jgi:predicted nucleic acid-binding Zn finger protein
MHLPQVDASEAEVSSLARTRAGLRRMLHMEFLNYILVCGFCSCCKLSEYVSLRQGCCAMLYVA